MALGAAPVVQADPADFYCGKENLAENKVVSLKNSAL
jgi:hypothetical protein